MESSAAPVVFRVIREMAGEIGGQELDLPGGGFQGIGLGVP